MSLKRSLGLTRGKTDKINAQRLAYYAFLHRHALKSTKLPSVILLKLKNPGDRNRRAVVAALFDKKQISRALKIFKKLYQENLFLSYNSRLAAGLDQIAYSI